MYSVKRFIKIAGGVMLVAGGVFWFLPVLGFWMLPLGLGLLGTEIPAVRAFNVRLKRSLKQKARQFRKKESPR